MGAALVGTDGSWHQNMPWKWLDKNNRILPAVFKEVCWRLIKDSDLCGLHRKQQTLCFLNNGAFQCGYNVQHFQQRAQCKDGGGLIKDRKWKSSLAPLSGIFGNQFFSSWTLVLFYFSFGVGGCHATSVAYAPLSLRQQPIRSFFLEVRIWACGPLKDKSIFDS